MQPKFMPWVDLLPEVGDPIRNERNKLAAKLRSLRILACGGDKEHDFKDAAAASGGSARVTISRSWISPKAPRVCLLERMS